MRASLVSRLVAASIVIFFSVGAVAGAEETRDKTKITPRTLYMLNCAGCHQPNGSGTADGEVPSMRGVIGHFTRLPEGRAFLVQVPGTLNSGLSDQEIADLLNWLVPTYAGNSMPKGFVLYTPREIERLRADAPANLGGRRAGIVESLRAMGYVVP